jgi:predicted CXXCH cytochrome family protein
MISTRSGLLLLLGLAVAAPASELLTITTDGAPGYVADKVCANCHKGHYDSYQHVGMAQSFKKPENARHVERFGETFFHQASQRYYEIHQRKAGLMFRRYQQDKDGEVINETEIPIHWVLGSGNRARSYIHQNDHGELFQLPVGWYAEGGHWEMSPGFEARDHDGLGRKLNRECMFCHNAYPRYDLDAYADPEIFPHDLPEGIGCQRCHGPGGKHVDAALRGVSFEVIRGAIVNPGKLTGEVKDSVCMQCHLLPAMAIVGPRRFGRGDYSFRPGELLTDYMVHLDIRESGLPEPERFEINHHGYRFLKSACYQQSEGTFSCTSCHNPHVKAEPSSFRQAVAGVCQNCHGDVAHESPRQHTDCATCHMPTRRTRDVIHVTMTDHWIARGPFDLEQTVEPVEAGVRPISEVTTLPFGDPPAGLDEQAYVALGAMRAGRSLDDATRSLLQVIQKKNYDHYAPYLDFARAQLLQGRFSSAEASARGLVNTVQDLHVAQTLMGIAQMAQGEFDQAIVAFRKSLEVHPDPETHFNLAAAYMNTGELALAERQLEQALALRPTLSAAHRLMGQIHLAGSTEVKARDSLIHALRLDPGDTAAYALLVPLLNALDDQEAAEKYLELGRRSARQPGSLQNP